LIAIDTSALIAILLAEPEADAFEHRIVLEPVCMSTVSLQEASMVLVGRRPDRGAAAWQRLDEIISEVPIEIVAYDQKLAEIGRVVFVQLGERPASGQAQLG
jgi:ribonuclease VapC